MKKQIRSRVLALGVAGVLVAGGALPLIPMAVAQTQGTASAAELLTRGAALLKQAQFATAKKVLLSINPSQLTPVERTNLESLLEKADVGLAASAKAEDIFHNAQMSFQDGHLAHAASLYRYLIQDSSAAPEIRRDAQDNLALTEAKQKEMVPAMNQLLQKAIAAYNAKNYDAAEADLYTIRKSGVDLGSNNNVPATYENLIAQQRVAQVNAIIAAEKAKAAAAAESQLKAQQQAAQAAQAAKEAKLAMAQKQAAAQAARLAAARQAQEAKAAAAAHQLAMQKAAAAAALAAHEQQVQQQLAAQQNQQETQRAAQRAAAALAAQKQAEQEAVLAKLAAEQKARAAAAAKLAAEQKAKQAAEAAAAAAAREKAQAAALAARQAAQEKAAQAAAREKAALALAAKQKLSAQQKAQELAHSQQPMAPVHPVSGTPATPKPTSTVQPALPMESLAQVNAERASLLVVEADDAVKAGKYQNAITLYTAALALNPHNVAARLGRRNAKKLASGQSVSLLSQTIYSNAILAQRAQVMFNTALEQSNAQLKIGHYNRALNSADNAEAAATSSRHLLSPRAYHLMMARAKQQIAMVQQQQAMAQAAIAKIQAQKIQQSQVQLEARVAAERRIRVNELMQTANNYYKQQQYQHALDTLDQIVAIDPQDYTARFMRRMVQDQIQYTKYNHYANHRSHSIQENEVANEEETIPYQRLLIYPRDWPELSRMREAEMTSSESPMDRTVDKRLGENDPKISASQIPFENVIDLLRNQTGLNIVVNWSALAAAGVEKTSPVSLTLRDVPFKKVLQIVLQQVQGGGSTQLGYSVDQGVITISTNDQLAQQKVVRVYDIQDLLVKAPNFSNFPQFNLQSATQNTNTSVSSGSAGSANNQGNLFGGGAGGAGSAQSTTTSKKAMVREITKLIENTVDRNTWVDNGGTVGTIREISGQLVVSQTPAAQQKITSLLQQLRESRAIQISIEARFLLVGTNFLNDFAFGWNLTFPQGFFGPDIAPLTINNNTAAIAAPRATGIVGSLGGNGAGTGTASPTNALDVSGGILSNYQLNLFMQATQEDVHTTTVTAPRITLFNGQQAYITVAQQQNFVSSFTQTVGGGGINGVGGVGTNLNISTLTTGVVLAVQATVSADHRYVVMTLQPSLSTLNGLQTFNISGQSTEAATTSGIPLAGGFVQLPNISLTELATTVSVPDGGTLLIGGQRLVGEVEVESGVPILSKIPIINRLFTNRSFVRDTKVLLILVRPHIIIQKEAEKKQFGQNY